MKANIICVKYRPKVITETIVWEIIHYSLIRFALTQHSNFTESNIKSFTFNSNLKLPCDLVTHLMLRCTLRHRDMSVTFFFFSFYDIIFCRRSLILAKMKKKNNNANSFQRFHNQLRIQTVVSESVSVDSGNSCISRVRH